MESYYLDAPYELYLGLQWPMAMAEGTRCWKEISAHQMALLISIVSEGQYELLHLDRRKLSGILRNILVQTEWSLLHW